MAIYCIEIMQLVTACSQYIRLDYQYIYSTGDLISCQYTSIYVGLSEKQFR